MTLREFWLDPLDQEQRAAAEAPVGPVMALGGPGTGKSDTIRGRVAFLVEGGADPEAILFIAAGEGGTHPYFQRVGRLPDHLRSLLPPGVFTPLGLACQILNQSQGGMCIC